MSNFKNVFRQLRTSKQMTQQELADALKISRSAVCMYEKGEREPSFEQAEAIADFFNVDMNYLMGTETCSTYYLEPEAADLASFLLDNKEYKVLFDASRKVKPEDIKKALKAIQLFTEED